MTLPDVHGAKFFRFAAAEHGGKFGIIIVDEQNRVAPVGPCEAASPEQAMQTFRAALEQLTGPYRHPDHT